MSKFAQKVKRYYDADLWTRSMVMDAHEKGRLTAEEYEQITGEQIEGEDGDDTQAE